MQRKWLLPCIAFLTSSLCAAAQWVKEDDTTAVYFREGVYMTQEEFFSNRPTMSLRSLSSSRWKTADSLMRLGIFVASPASLRFTNGNLDVRSRFIAIMDSTGRDCVAMIDTVWGICLHGIPFKYIENAADQQFVRIPITGAINFLNYVVLEQDVPEFHTVSFPTPGYRRIERRWIVDMERREIVPFSHDYLYSVLERDTHLLKRFEKERKKRRQLLPYIGQYNASHPFIPSE
jgi:hypothetical protein